MKALLLRKGKKEVYRREGRGGKRRGKDLRDQCQSASYAPGACTQGIVHKLYTVSHVVYTVRAQSSGTYCTVR